MFFGHDSQGWLLEEERMAAVVTQQNREESAEADKETDAGGMRRCARCGQPS